VVGNNTILVLTVLSIGDETGGKVCQEQICIL